MKQQRAPGDGGFTLVEILVATALAGVLITMVVMSYQALVANGGTRTSYGTVTVGSALTNFYGGTATTLDAYFAPNYGRAAQAELVRQQFIDDIHSASAVFCLGRNLVNTTHPTTIPLATTFRGDSCDTPEAFRGLLTNAISSSASTFTNSYRGASTATNASIFILKPSQSTNVPMLSVQAVYDIDLTAATFSDPEAAGGAGTGTYASVKRYDETGSLTDYYDVFYPNDAKTPALSGTVAFNPLVVCFERAVRSFGTDPSPNGALKVAAARPFYFIWWPDPTSHTLKAVSAPSYDASDIRATYGAMGGRTAFFFVVPMFPSL